MNTMKWESELDLDNIPESYMKKSVFPIKLSDYKNFINIQKNEYEYIIYVLIYIKRRGNYVPLKFRSSFNKEYSSKYLIVRNFIYTIIRAVVETYFAEEKELSNYYTEITAQEREFVLTNKQVLEMIRIQAIGK